MARLIFVTGTSPDVESGSGTSVGIAVLRHALVGSGHVVDLLAPSGGRGPMSLPARLAFDLRARTRVRRLSASTPPPDAVVGFDLDGVFLPRGGGGLRVAAIKGTLAEEAEHERGLSRLRLEAEAVLEKRHARRADLVIAPSEHSASAIRRFYGVSRDRIAVVPEPIDLARWRGALGDFRGSPSAGGRILCVAHLYPRKDVATLLDAMALLPSEARLRVIGTGPERKALLARAAALRLGERVVLAGHVPFDRLAEEYRSADVFCLPSRQEGFGIVFLEAMAAGLPIVAARATAVPEVVADRECGLLVPPGDAPALASALQSVLGDASLRQRLAESGRRRVTAYDAPLIARKFLAAIAGAPTELANLRTADAAAVSR
ncbi:MAG: glycosyltransferase family 4 protein [Acidobacteriota bacterium]